jgi:hypothetical protein
MKNKETQAMRLYRAVEKLTVMAGEDVDETIDWLCGEHGGMFKLIESYFSPKTQPCKPLTFEQREEIGKWWHSGSWTLGDIIDHVEQAHGIGDE